MICFTRLIFSKSKQHNVALSGHELLTKLTANSGWAWRGVGKACWERENAARSTLKSNPGLSACHSRNEVAGGAPPDRGRLIAAVVAIALPLLPRHSPPMLLTRSSAMLVLDSRTQLVERLEY